MTPPNGEPTLGEVMRRLDEVAKQLGRMANEMREDRQQNAATFVRQDVYIAQRHADQAVVADLHGDIRTVKDERKQDQASRRQIWLSLGIAALSTVTAIALAVVNLLAR